MMKIMKTNKYYIFSLIFAVLTVFSGKAWGEIANPYSFTFAQGDLTTSSTSFTKGEVTWNLSAQEDQWQSPGYRFGSGNNPKNLTISTNDISGTITEVTVTGKSNNNGKTAAVAVKVGISDFTTDDGTWESGSTQTLTFSGSASGTIEVSVTPSQCGFIFCGISVTYTTGPTTYTVTINKNFDSYGSVSKASVADLTSGTSISANGNVLTIGTTEVTAIAADQDADYTYAFSNWSDIPVSGEVTDNITVIANFTRTERQLENYRTVCCTELGTITGSIALSQANGNITANGWDATTDGNENGYLVRLYNSDKSSVITSANTGSKATKTHTFTNPGAGTYWVSVSPTYSGAGNFCEIGTETFSASSITLTGNVVVTFKLNGGTVAGDEEKTQEVPVSTNTPLTSIATLGYVAPDCKEFVGWAASEEDANAATPVVFKADEATINVSEATNLWAIWNTKTLSVAQGTGTAVGCEGETFTFASSVACGGNVTITSSPDATHKAPYTITVLPADAYEEIDGNVIKNVTKPITSISVSYTAKTSYAITWKVNDAPYAPHQEELDGKVNGDALVYEGGAITTLPTAPADNTLGCANKFMGWSTHDYKSVKKTASDYDDLFTTASGAPEISKATIFYAVFATQSGSPVENHNGPSWERSGTDNTVTSGYTFSATASAKTDYYQDASSGTGELKLYHTSTPIFSSKPSSVTLSASIGAGNDDTDFDNYVYARLLDQSGNGIGNAIQVTNHITNKAGDTYTPTLDLTGITSAYGVMLYHDKESSKNIRYYSFSLSYTTGGTTTTDYVTECAAVEAPTFSVAAGTYNVAQSVELSCATNGATIYYTTNNTTPSDASTEYTGAIAVNQNMTIKAIAIKGSDESDVAEAAYVLQVVTPEISGATSFVSSATVTIAAADGTSIYYTTNGVDPTTESTPYTAPFTVDADGTTTVKAISVKAGWTSSEIASQAFTKITPKTVAEANTAIAALSANGTIANQYVKGLISQIDKFNEDNTITYYISDNGTTASQLQVYHGSAGVANNGNAFTAKENLQLGEEVIVSGTLKKYEKSNNNYVYEFDKPNSIIAYKTHSPIAWSANAYTAELGGSENEFPTLSGTTGLTISYSSSDETVATISADGTTYDLKKTGETTITATSAATDDFVATTKSYTLTVSPTVIRVDLDIDCNGATSGCPETTHLVKQTSLPNPLPEVTKTGKNFGGWYTDNNTFETPAVAGAALTENTTIYAQWLEPYTVAEALTMIAALGNDEKTAENVYVAGVVTADAVSIDNKTATYKIKDATVNNSLEVYKGKGLNNADVAAGDLQEGDQVVVYGQLMKYKGYSSTTKPEIVDPNYLYSFTRPTHNVESVSVASTANVRAGKTVTLTAEIAPANATNKNVTWSVKSGDTYAEVSAAGVVTGLAEGTAVIEVETEDGGFKAQCTVTVVAGLPTFTEDDHEWIKVSNASKLVAGRFYVIAESANGRTATTSISGNVMAPVASTFSADKSVIASGKLGTNTAIFELGGNTIDGWTLYEVTDEENTGYFSGANASSFGWSESEVVTPISFTEDGKAILGNASGYRLLYNTNNGNPRFKTYSSSLSNSMLLPQLYMWAELSHSVTFDANGGVVESVPGVERTDEGKIIIPATEPTHSDISKAFGGWYKSDAPSVLYNAGDEFETNVDVTLYAKWNTVPTYTVTYSANGGTGTAPAEPATVQAGTTITVVENTGYTKPGFVYAGWQVVYNDGTDHIITPNDEGEFTMVAYNVTIKALWEEPSNQKWVRVESTDELKTDGTKYIIVGTSSNVAMGAKGSGNFYTSVGIVKTGNYLNGPESMTKVTLEAGSGEGKFAIKHGTKYIYSENAKNIGEKNDASDWTITITNGVATIKTGTGDGWYLKYNSTQPRFNTYASGQQAVAIYREKALTPIDQDGMTEADVNTYDDVEIGQDKTWTVSGEIEVGDVYMKEGAVIANSAEVTANDLYFKTKAGKSNQIYDASNLAVVGDLYYDVQLCDGDLDADYWYSIAVPFDVDLNSGVFQADGSPMTNRVDFEVWGYDTQLRAQTQSNGWKRVTDNMMHAGKAYLIGFNPGQPNIIRLKAAAGWKTNLFNGTSMQVVAAGSGDHANWNGLANPTMRYIDVDKDAQVFNNNTHGWDTYALDAARYNFVVGTAFFVQSASAVTISNDDHGQYRAPKRVDETKCAYAVRITRDEATSFDNQIIVRASEEATGTYTQGHDMLTMNGTSSNTAAMLWTENYGGKRLAIEEAAWLNDQASYALNMYAPKAGTYSISVAETKDNADLYLTQYGAIIWNLSMSAYELSLNKGLTSNYGLLLIKKAPGIATGVDEISGEKAGVQKIVLEDKVFILRGGKMYDVTGKAVK